jgi:hypothetical protein
MIRFAYIKCEENVSDVLIKPLSNEKITLFDGEVVIS